MNKMVLRGSASVLALAVAFGPAFGQALGPTFVYPGFRNRFRHGLYLRYTSRVLLPNHLI